MHRNSDSEGRTGGKRADDYFFPIKYVNGEYFVPVEYVNGFDKGNSWAERSASLQELETLHKYFIASRGKMVHRVESPGIYLYPIYKSIVTLLDPEGDLGDLSPLGTIGFIYGALAWRLQRNRLERLRLREKKRLLALPISRQDSLQFGQAANLSVRARAAPSTNAGAAMNAAHDADNASHGLIARHREQHLQALREEEEFEAFLSEVDQ